MIENIKNGGNMIENIKLSRRDFTKVVVGAGAFYLAPYGLEKIRIDLVGSGNLNSDSTDNDPLAVVVKNNELVGFRGFEEFIVKDNELFEELSSGYMGEPDPDYSEDNPVVVLVKDDTSIKFRGLGEFVIRDNDMVRRLSSKFRSNVGG